MVKNKKIKVESTEISVSLSETTDNDYICLTDMARFKDSNRRIMSSRIGCVPEALSNTWECGSN